MAVPCVPDNAVAKMILGSCAAAFAGHKGDCNQFLKAALGPFLESGYLDGLDADRIVGKLQNPAEGWTTVREVNIAITMAKSGNLVIAGMTSTALNQSHGHVAVIVGCDGQLSSANIVPIGYAGSLGNPAAQLEGGRLSGTFAAALVRSEGLDYYCKTPDRTPT